MTLDLVVADKEKLADGVVRLTLRAPDGRPLPSWEPGAHVDLRLPGGVVRQYSLCGAPGDTTAYQVAVLREPGGRGGSAYVHDELGAGQQVQVDGPRNHFALVDAKRYLFVAGGIGITPILPMIDAVAETGREWQLLYGGRTRSSMAFTADLRRHGDRVAIRPQDEHGLLDLPALLAEPRPDTAVYCCGPEPLLTAAERQCAGWPEGALRVERFTPVADDGPRTAFEVELAGSGRVLTVPAGRSILEVVEESGVPVLSSCQEGTCGTCETGVLDGIPDHRDSVLTAEERRAGEVMMICVSRSCSPRLVLDL
ncbi:ferredoxin [Amycolatopsis sp. NBRC 101858]|uniref:PDR/VanB family oxidoreductase n=1 Tax=Amycolatopsis sp. NBRC 101858 TaxID=3032200 RepID=UPI0024A0C886|nr:PDR/VanB family oxidoreductase [Amycolatopsis sp. NBRC 101858]GLY34236.1 ferredoxin [Amycolatopsis sp. NBRC 101858]